MNLSKTAETLCSAVGVAGAEKEASFVAAELLKPFVQSVEVDAFHNVTGIVQPAKTGQPTVLLEAHIDEIGMIVNQVDSQGFLKVSACGGIDRRLLLGQEVVVHAKQPMTGVVATIPPHLSDGSENKIPSMDDIAIDIGLNEEQAKQKVLPGDLVTLQSTFRKLLGDRICAKALDDRIGVVVILEVVEKLKAMQLDCGIAVLFSAQEEVGLRGAKMAGYRIHADLIFSFDVSFAQTLDSDPLHSFPLGCGTLIGKSPVLTRRVFDKLEAVALQQNIPHRVEVMGGSTGTNADVLGSERGGAEIALLSIPQRYMHTPIEVVDLKDVQATADLVVAYLGAEFGGATA